MINNGELLLVEDKAALMERLGKKELKIHLRDPITAIPGGLDTYDLAVTDNGEALVYTYDTKSERTGITALLAALQNAGVQLADISTHQSSLEDIFVGIVKDTTS